MNRIAMGFLALGMGGCLLVWCLGCSAGPVDNQPPQKVTDFPADVQVISYASEGNLSALRALVEADPNLVKVRGPRNGTPLHFAAGKGHKDVVKYLLQKGADPHAMDDDGYTAADIAGQEGQNAVATMIQEAAAQTPPSGGAR